MALLYVNSNFNCNNRLGGNMTDGSETNIHDSVIMGSVLNLSQIHKLLIHILGYRRSQIIYLTRMVLFADFISLSWVHSASISVFYNS